jgi:hypothetical protein
MSSLGERNHSETVRRHELKILRKNIGPLKPRRQKSAPASPRFGNRVSAALSSRDTGERRASVGDDTTPARA